MNYPAIYYSACGLLWLLLTVFSGMAAWPGFPGWLAVHPKWMVFLLGTNQMPLRPVRTLRRFYWFLNGGWTWILIWSWWIMPALQLYFFKTAESPRAFQIARFSSIIIMALYAGVGFFSMGRAITIWLREIYPLRPEEPAAGTAAVTAPKKGKKQS